jgi:hypothetical protein
VALGASCATLLAVCALLLVERRRPRDDLGPPEDPEARRVAVSQLVARAAGVWDTAADADVGHLLAPDLVDREQDKVPISSNRFGLRERDFAVPKPPGTVRVVLLGDSFVMGHGVRAEDRFGVFLERDLAERAGGKPPPIEVLHVGVDTWNLHAECAYLRRALSRFAPDLVVHLVIGNDVDDNPSARGFGALSLFDPTQPARGDALFQVNGPNWMFGVMTMNYLSHGLDFESRERYVRAAADLGELARALRDAGARYLVVTHFGPLLPVAAKRLLPAVPDVPHLEIPRFFYEDASTHVSPNDWHWNRAGNEQVARMLYAKIRAERLLPALELAAWPQADELLARIATSGAAEAARDPDEATAADAARIAPAIDSFEVGRLDRDAAAQVHGGLHYLGFVGPYAAVIVRDEGRRALVVEGTRLDRAELAGARTRVFVDEVEVGAIELGGKGRFEERFPVPPAVAERRFVSVRLVAGDYVYEGIDLRRTVTLRLRRLALE